MDDRANTIAGWVLAAGIAALGLSILTGEYFHAERPEKMGYVVEGVEVEAEGGAEAEKPIETYLASATPAAGEQVFKKCAACHNANQGGPNALGPNLYHVLGEPIGKGRGFSFSDALASKEGAWNFQNMSDWLKSPKTFAPGTKMTFAGLSKPEDRAAVIVYLNQQSPAPLPLPAAAPAAEKADPAAGPASESEGGAPKAPDAPVPTEAQAAQQPEGNVKGEAAPATSGRTAQEKN